MRPRDKRHDVFGLSMDISMYSALEHRSVKVQLILRVTWPLASRDPPKLLLPCWALYLASIS